MRGTSSSKIIERTKRVGGRKHHAEIFDSMINTPAVLNRGAASRPKNAREEESLPVKEPVGGGGTVRCH